MSTKLQACSGIINTADWHLPGKEDAAAWTQLPELANDPWHVLSWLVDNCIERNYCLSVAGDVYDSPNVKNYGLAKLAEQVNRLKAQGLSCFYILGNHDRGEHWPKWAGCEDLSETAIELTNGRNYSMLLTGLSYCRPEHFLDKAHKLYKRYPDNVVALLHQTWKDWTYNGIGDVHIDELPTWDTVVLGDFHGVRRRLRQSEGKGPRLALSPGPLSRRSTRESGVAVGYIFDKTPREYTAITLPGRPFAKEEINTQDDQERIINILAGIEKTPIGLVSLDRPLLEVRYAGEQPELISGIREAAKDKAYVIMRPIISKKDDDNSELEADEFSTTAELVTSAIPESFGKHLTELMTKLLKSIDIGSSLEEEYRTRLSDAPQESQS